MKYIKENNIKYFIDIHGMLNEKSSNIIIGTNNYKNVNNNKELVEKIENIFRTRLTKYVSIDEIYKAGEKTICSYVNKNTGVIALQFEIAKNYRKLKRRPKSFNKLILTLIKIINEIEEK